MTRRATLSGSARPRLGPRGGPILLGDRMPGANIISGVMMAGIVMGAMEFPVMGKKGAFPIT